MMNGAQYLESLKKRNAENLLPREAAGRVRMTILRLHPTFGPRRRRTTWRWAGSTTRS